LLESCPAYDSAEVAQGDIFQWASTTHDCDIGVVVTADCDIAHGKFGTHYTYVPVLPLPVYLRRFFLPARLGKIRTQLLTDISNRVWKIQRENRTDFSDRISDAVLSTWVLETAADEILRELRVGSERESSQLTAELSQYQRISRTIDAEDDSTDPIQEMTATGKVTQKKLHQEIHAHVKQLPGDRMYLSSVDGASGPGYVILLRNLREIAIDDIAISPSQTSAAAARRIARLNSPYRYRLTQQLGEVFSAIGLPTPYEERRNQVLADAYKLETGAP
jgi:hypothetical protein